MVNSCVCVRDIIQAHTALSDTKQVRKQVQHKGPFVRPGRSWPFQALPSLFIPTFRVRVCWEELGVRNRPLKATPLLTNRRLVWLWSACWEVSERGGGEGAKTTWDGAERSPGGTKKVAVASTRLASAACLALSSALHVVSFKLRTAPQMLFFFFSR